ncbi:MAG: methyltransferase domain-containing protein [Actinophytocola sp.]|nr:methyltransferase domain-containing protein [Actinophytocola sp.]
MRSEDWDAKFGASEFLFTDKPNQTVAAEVAALPPGSALDLAAGQGRNAVWLAQQGWDVTAVDFSPVGLDRARRLAAANDVDVTFVLADVLTWQPQRACYDLVLISYLQLPAGQLRSVLNGAVAALAPGGTLLVIGHDRDNLTRGYGGPQDGDVLYSVDDLLGAVAGLRVEKAGQIDRVVDTELGPFTAIDTLVRAARPIAEDAS